MKHSIDDLFQITYRHYTRGVGRYDPQFKRTPEHACLVAARRRAGAEEAPWRALLERVEEQYLDRDVQNGSLHLHTGSWDAGYIGRVFLPPTAPAEERREVSFLVSFLVPYYVVYAAHAFRGPPSPEQAGKLRVFLGHGTYWLLPALAKLAGVVQSVVYPEHVMPPELQRPGELRQEITFDMRPDEAPIAAWLAQQIEAMFGYEPMPPEVGLTIVPDVTTDSRDPGQARLYDCLFTDNW